jgi:hypothetical protein
VLGLFSTLIDRFDRLHQQDGQVIHRARADAAVMKGTCFADPVAIVLQVRPDPVTPHFVDGIDDLWQVHLDPALLAQGGARRAIGRPFDTSATDLLADLMRVLG